MNYHCFTPFEGDVCPVCGSARVREIREDDECLVLEGDAVQTGILEDVLKQEQIPCFRQSQTGAAMAMFTGRQLERFNVLVPYSRYEEAKEIAAGLLAPVEPTEDGVLFEDEDYEGEREEEDDED